MSAIDKRIAIMLWGVAIVVIVGGVFLAVRLWNLDWPVWHRAACGLASARSRRRRQP